MNIIKRERVIPPEPERTVTETFYVASDGEEFRYQSECERYEKRLKIESHPVVKSCVKTDTYYEDYTAYLYYLSSEGDYDFWVANIGTPFLEVNHWADGFGPGWYLFYSVDGGDYADSHYLYKLDEYEKMFREKLDSWCSDVQDKIAEHKE